MNTDVKTVSLPESKQTKAESRETAPAFRLQTGVRAGGWRETWATLTPEQQAEYADRIF
jgi:hypothetical protein